MEIGVLNWEGVEAFKDHKWQGKNNKTSKFQYKKNSK